MKKQDPRLIDQRRITEPELAEMKKLSEKLFQGAMFKQFTPEEEASPEMARYNTLMKKNQFSHLMALTLDRKK